MTKKLLGELELNRIYQRDCLEGMRMIPDKSVDLIVIDPPYNIGKDKRWDKWETVDGYVAFMTEVFKECERILARNGSFYYWHNDFEQITELQRAIKLNTDFVFKQLIVWNKRFDGAGNKGFLDGFVEVRGLRNYQKMAEYCLFFTLQDEGGSSEAAQGTVKQYLRSELTKYGKAADINRLFWRNGWAKEGSNIASHFFGNNSQNCLPTPENYARLQTTGYFNRNYTDLLTEYEKAKYTYNNLRTHHSVWNYEIAPKQGHITPKPIDLIENIILHSSNEGDIVLDCFMGSGTTAVAAARLNRKFIGFEREPEYVEIANKRIDNEEEAK